MLNALTNAELMQLSHALSSGAHSAHNVTEVLALAAGLFPITSTAEERIWDARRSWVALADELADLAADCRATRAALAVKMAADA